jgi:hypothetical protein
MWLSIPRVLCIVGREYGMVHKVFPDSLGLLGNGDTRRLPSTARAGDIMVKFDSQFKEKTYSHESTFCLRPLTNLVNIETEAAVLADIRKKMDLVPLPVPINGVRRCKFAGHVRGPEWVQFNHLGNVDLNPRFQVFALH